MAKQLVGVRMSETGRSILDTLTADMGLTQAGVIELALRELAKKQGVKIPVTETKESKST